MKYFCLLGVILGLGGCEYVTWPSQDEEDRMYAPPDPDVKKFKIQLERWHKSHERAVQAAEPAPKAEK